MYILLNTFFLKKRKLIQEKEKKKSEKAKFTRKGEGSKKKYRKERTYKEVVSNL